MSASSRMSRAGRTGQRAEAEQVVDELFARDDRPAPLERFPHLGPVADAGAELGLPTFGRRLAAREGAGDGRVGGGVTVEDARDVVDRFGAGDVGSPVGQPRRVELARPEVADERFLVARDEHVDEAADDELALLVVRAPPPAGPLDDARRVAPRDAASATRR